MNNYEVEELLRKHIGGRLKVFPTRARDEFKGNCPIGCGIVNMDVKTGPGTHFTLWINLPNDKHVNYFDSYGVVPPAELEAWLKTSGRPIAYSSSQLQPIASALCGYYCVYAAVKTLESSFFNALMSFDKVPESNDILMENYFSRG